MYMRINRKDSYMKKTQEKIAIKQNARENKKKLELKSIYIYKI
jgi:hypothetical protein